MQYTGLLLGVDRSVELRDREGKLQGKWDPAAGVLEIQRRGVKTRYWLGKLTRDMTAGWGQLSILNPTRVN